MGKSTEPELFFFNLQTSAGEVSHVGDAVLLPEINGEVGEELVPGILHDVSREQVLMRILLKKDKKVGGNL